MSERVRNCCVTFNNYPENFDPTVFDSHCKYYIIAREIGESGTPHLQCYLEFITQKSYTKIKKLFNGNVHIEPRKGTPQQAADYCKKDNLFVQFGVLSEQGRRNDIKRLRDEVKRGATLAELYELDAMYRYRRSAMEHRYILQTEKVNFTPMTVTVLIGPPGCGKTRFCYKTDPYLYNLASRKPLWFDGYNDNKSLLIDDYYGEIEYSAFLRMLDGYRFGLPIKGGFTWKNYSEVFITSNVPICQWYPDRDTNAILRRITDYRNPYEG